MRVLFYSHYFSPSVGGVETSVRSLAAGISEFRGARGQSFEVVFVTQTDPQGFDDSTLPFPVIRRPGLLQLLKLIRKSDLVHVAGPSLTPLFLARLARKPAVAEHHGYQAVCPNGLLLHQPERSICPGHFQAGRYLKCLSCETSAGSLFRGVKSLLSMFPRRFLSRRVHRNIAITDHVAARQSLPNSVVIHYGIEELQQPRSASAERPEQEKICFAFVGRLVSEKGIATLIRAAQQLTKEQHPWEIRLVGDGPERANLEAMIRDAKLQNSISITGYLTGSALTEALQDVRVVVMPSIWEETAGLAAIEQMMRGKLVIASDVGGLREVIGNAGLLVPTGDADALADCMKSVLHDPSLVYSLGQRASRRARDLFARERMIKDHALVYQEVIEASQTR
jgi:glycosyltransferase involved in cell wall biosynthesis